VAGTGEQKNEEGKGFAGLSSLVSDIDVASLDAMSAKGISPTEVDSHAEVPVEESDTHLEEQPTKHRRSAKTSRLLTADKWVLGVLLAFFGFVFFSEQSWRAPTRPGAANSIDKVDEAFRPAGNEPKLASAPESPKVSAPLIDVVPPEEPGRRSPPEQGIAPSDSPPAPMLTPPQPPPPSHPTESKPPVGQDLVLSMEQIRYCLAEGIRMDGAKSVVNNYSDSDVDRFNSQVADYNSRCGSFRYHSGVLEGARREIEPYRIQLQSEGRSRFARPPDGTLSEPTSSHPAPAATVQAIQRKLNELGYEAGNADGLSGRRTRAAIIAFQQDRALAVTGVADQALLLQLQLATAPGVTIATSTAVSTNPIGKKLYHAVCVTCHSVGVAGAPKFGDKAAWKPYIKTGVDAMLKKAISGVGAMPPRGGSSATDAEIKAAIQYMVDATK
jgi:cytochrome c5